MGVQAQEKTPPATPPLKLTIEGKVEGALIPVAGGMTALFYESYPKLLARFENPERPAPREIRVVFDEALTIPAHCVGGTLTVGSKWLRAHPEDIALLTHELTHSVQAYPKAQPLWLTEGIADYSRHVYGPKEQAGWKLPDTFGPQQSYKEGYRVAARFLVWLEQKHPGIVDTLHRRMQKGDFSENEFQTLTGKTVDELWKQCVAELAPKGS